VLATRVDQAPQHLNDSATTDGRVDVDRQARPSEVVNHRKDAKTSAVVKQVEDEVERRPGPRLPIGPGGQRSLIRAFQRRNLR
jgi:hypothetical protein